MNTFIHGEVYFTTVPMSMTKRETRAAKSAATAAKHVKARNEGIIAGKIRPVTAEERVMWRDGRSI